MSTAAELLKAFAADRQLPGLASDGDTAGLMVEGRTQVDLRADGDRLYVYSSLGPVPQANEEAVLTLLLMGNLAGSLGEGPVLAIDPAQGDIVMSQELDARTASSATVLRTIGAIADQVDVWRRRLGEVDGKRKPQPEPESRAEQLAFLTNRA